MPLLPAVRLIAAALLRLAPLISISWPAASDTPDRPDTLLPDNAMSLSADIATDPACAVTLLPVSKTEPSASSRMLPAEATTSAPWNCTSVRAYRLRLPSARRRPNTVMLSAAVMSSVAAVSIA